MIIEFTPKSPTNFLCNESLGNLAKRTPNSLLCSCYWYSSLSLSLSLLIITPLINFNCWVWFHLQSGASVSVWFCHSDKIIRPVQCHRLSWGWVDGDRNGSFIGFIGFPEPWTFSYERIIRNKSIIFWYLFLNWPFFPRWNEHPRG